MHWVILASTFGRYSNHIIDALLGDRLLFRSKGGKSKMLSHKSPRQSLMQKRAKNCSAGVQHCAIMIPCAQVGVGWELELSHRIAVNTCDFYVMFTFLVIKNMQSLFYSQFLKEQKPVTASPLHVFLQLVTNTNMWLKDAAPRNRRRGRFLQISWRGQELCATWQKLCNFSPVFSDSLDIIHVSQELQEFSLVNVMIYDMFPYISPPRWPWRLPKRSRSRIRWDLEGMGCLWGDVLSCRFVDYVPSSCRIGGTSNTHDIALFFPFESVNRDVSHTSKLLRVAAGGAATGVQSPHHQRTSEGARRSCSYFGEWSCFSKVRQRKTQWFLQFL